MNCEQFRINLNSTLDVRSSILLTEEMKQHSETCADCRQYETSILLLHEELLRIPRLQPSKALLHQLHSIPSEQGVRDHTISWKPELQQAAILAIPAFIAVMCRWLFNGIGIFVELGVVTLGLSLLILNLMKPAILGKYSELTTRQ
jgi:predicted anti-sigma-YlaC factor YlaD